MARIVIISERPGWSVEIAKALAHHNPWDGAEIHFVHTAQGVNQQFHYLRGWRWAEFPMILEPICRTRKQWTSSGEGIPFHTTPARYAGPDEFPFQMLYYKSPDLGESGSLPCDSPLTPDQQAFLHAASDEAFERPITIAMDLIRAADQVVYAVGGDYRRRVLFYRLLREALGDNIPSQCPLIHIEPPTIRSEQLDQEAIRKAVAEAPQTLFIPAKDQALAYGLAKDHFDYNYNVNALGILGATVDRVWPKEHLIPVRHAKRAGGAIPSKYGLQVLYYIRRKQREGVRLTSFSVIDAMADGFGTGKYQGAPFGSRDSKFEIFSQLLGTDLLTTPTGVTPALKGEVVLSDIGERLLAALHPDCEDPDLAGRLAAWCQAGLEPSRPAMDRYIRTFFGKQKRFLAKS